MLTDPREQFRDALARRNIIPPTNIAADGMIHRCDAEGRNGQGDAAYLLHLDGIAAGGFENWRDGLGWETWRADIGRKLSHVEAAELSRRAAEAKAKREAEEAQRHAEARERAAAKWQAAKPADPAHPYLVTKGVRPHGIRQDGDALLIPLRASGELHSIQSIASDGGKRFLSGGRVTGCYFSIGKPDGTLCIAEGYATGASIFEATGYAAAVAFNAGNLDAVARELRSKYPDMRIIVCADDDYRTDGNPGIREATKAARAVGGLLGVPDFGEDRPHGATDFNDLARHTGADAIKRALATAAAPDVPEAPADGERGAAGDPGPPRFVAVTMLELIKAELPERVPLLTPWLYAQGLAQVHAWRGIGKTHFSLGVAYAVATGGEFLGWKASEPRRVLFIDGEMPAVALKERLSAIIEADTRDCEVDADNLRLITPDLLSGAPPDLADPNDQGELQRLIDAYDPALVIVDNISTLVRSGGAENDAEAWIPVQGWALRMRKDGRAVLFVHHTGKGGKQRGTSKREDVLDIVIALKRPEPYNPEDGARFVLEFEKTRYLKGEDARAFEAHLTTDEHGRQAWTIRNIEDSTLDRVVALHRDGMTGVREIAAELGVVPSTVSRQMKKAAALGLIENKRIA